MNNDEAPGGRAVGTSPGRNNPEARTGRRPSGRTSRGRSRAGSDVGPGDGNLTRHIQHQPYSFPGDLGLQGTTLVNQPGGYTARDFLDRGREPGGLGVRPPRCKC